MIRRWYGVDTELIRRGERNSVTALQFKIEVCLFLWFKIFFLQVHSFFVSLLFILEYKKYVKILWQNLLSKNRYAAIRWQS